MRLFAFALVMACKQDASPCPTVAALDEIGAPNDHATDVIIREMCVRDHWPATVTDCLRAATTDAAAETCLRLLPPEQGTKLKARIRATGEPSETSEDRNEKEAGEILFEDKLAARHPTFGSSPECDTYLHTITSTLKATIECTSIDALTLFGGQQLVLARLKKLDGLEETAKPVECTAANVELAAEKALHCTP